MNFSPDSKTMNFFGKLVDLVRINVLWLLCCLPIFTIGASTTAMLTCLYAYKAGEPCGAKTFFQAFRKSFGKATLLWLLIAFFGAMLVWITPSLPIWNFPGGWRLLV